MLLMCKHKNILWGRPKLAVSAWRALWFVAAALAQPSYALRPALSMQCLIRESRLVIVGKVISISAKPVLRDYLGSVHVAEVRVLQTILGDARIAGRSSTLIEVATREDFSGEGADLKAGNTYVLFVSYSEAGPFVTNGAQGAIKVVDGVIAESESSPRLSVEDFAENIRRASKDSCDG